MHGITITLRVSVSNVTGIRRLNTKTRVGGLEDKLEALEGKRAELETQLENVDFFL